MIVSLIPRPSNCPVCDSGMQTGQWEWLDDVCISLKIGKKGGKKQGEGGERRGGVRRERRERREKRRRERGKGREKRKKEERVGGRREDGVEEVQEEGR